MLIDKEGTIVFKGHPAGRPNLEDDLSKLGRGEKLEGTGISELQADDTGAAPEIKTEEGFTEMDTNSLSLEIVKFKEACSGWQQDSAIQEAAKGMMRSFCVVVLQQCYNPQTEKYNCKYENFRVLVGAQAKIDTIEAKFKTLDEGYTFKVNNQV